MYRAPLNFDHQKTFERKEDIKPWLSAKLSEILVNVAIERSDNIKIVFRCKDGSPLCPFRVRANFSSRSGLWTLLVVNELHNHRVENGIEVTKRDLIHMHQQPAFINMDRPQEAVSASSAYVENLGRKMSSEVARIVSTNVWQNPRLSHEQKEAAVANFVASMVDEYLENTPKNTNALLPLSPLPSVADPGTQLPALAAATRLNGPLPPFNSLQNQLPPLPGVSDAAKTLNPIHLMKAATHDLSEFKVDNMGAPSALLTLLTNTGGAPLIDKGDGGLLSHFNLMGYTGW